MQNEILQPEIRYLIDTRDESSLRNLFAEWEPTDIVQVINDLGDNEEKEFIFSQVPEEKAPQVFEFLDLSLQETFLEVLPIETIRPILNAISPDDRTALFEELPAAKVTQMLSLLTPEERAVSLNLLGYPEQSIGRLMTPDYIAVKQEWTVQEVLNYIRKHGQDKETLNVVYVVDEKGFLVDDIKVREFLLASPSTKVSDLMDEKFTFLTTLQDQEEAVNVFRKLNRVALPVTDIRGVLVGIVTIDDVLTVANEEDTEDIQKFGGTEALEEPYLNVSLFQMVKKRATWLVILFIGEMFTATAMGFFEDELKKALVLSLFIPLIISSGGNSGSQAATLIIRAMALGEVRIRDWWRVMRKEIFSGLSLGLILGFIGFIRVVLWASFSEMYGPHWLLIALVVGFTLVGVVMWGSLAGSMLPILLKRLGADPATSSAPFIATLVDVTGLVIYFGVALSLLSGVML